MSNALTALYCDDIRHEKTGKVSIIGIYGQKLIVNTIPTTLPKLCVHFSMILSHELIGKTAKVELLMNGKPHFAFDVEIDEDERPTDKNNRICFNGGFDMPFFEIKEKATLRLVADIDDIHLEGTALQIIDRETFESGKSAN